MTDTMMPLKMMLLMPSLLILIITLLAYGLHRRYRNRLTQILLLVVIVIDVLIALPVIRYLLQR